ncbi:MAG TPA: SpvB/TcaC N-terminal domain-containing protein [Nannocystaceae bacterium]|nr:SpvB/TcaC N-terminal domain-containing protein [Nannocystaceae bacterium]
MFARPQTHPTLARFVGQSAHDLGARAQSDAPPSEGAPRPEAAQHDPAAAPSSQSRPAAAPPSENRPALDWVPKVELPEGGGAVRGIGESFEANAFTGSGAFSVPLPLSPARGLQPQAVLTYASGSGNGPFGLGFGLSVPSIARKTDRELPRYVDGIESDTFVFGGSDLVPVRDDGERVVIDRTEHFVYPYRPRDEGAFLRIERWVAKADAQTLWRILDKGNVTSWFGRTAQARVVDPEDDRRVFEWRLEETSDDRGNLVRYTYKPEDAQVTGSGVVAESNRAPSAGNYLKRIHYGNREPAVADDWMFEVVFDYGEHGSIDGGTGEVVVTTAEDRAWPMRGDPFSSFRAGFDIRTRRRCERVLVFHRFVELDADAPVLVRSLDFEYDEAEHLAKLERIVARSYETGTVTNGYVAAEMPALELAYTSAQLQPQIRALDPDATDLPLGVDGRGFRFADLDGEGLPGIAAEIGGTLRYKRPEGEGRFGVLSPRREQVTTAKLGSGAQLVDVDGDGRLELATNEGYYLRKAGGDDLVGFVRYETVPTIDYGDPNLQRIDLNGDGHPDLLITRADGFHWYPSRGKAGYGERRFIARPSSDREGPSLLFADGTGTVFLADMTGDGLTDLVRVTHGGVVYWPNLGHGRFGRKVTMGGEVLLASSAEFHPAFVRLGDLDGSGTSDLIYLDSHGARVWLNRSGNGFAAPSRLTAFPGVDSATAVEIIDIYGKGTACLVWSTAADWAAPTKVWVLDLLPDKPHLLVSTTNNLGLETRLRWEPSTRLYLRDRAAGRPWASRLPFPVHVVTRVEQYDAVARRRFVQQYAYHHGFYDGVERELRGFAMVERWDTEAFESFNHAGLFSLELFDTVEENLHQPPVLTRTWFHTGAFFGRERLRDRIAGEYWQGDDAAWSLPDTVLPTGMTAAESREAARALRGRMLRQEVYALDGSEAEGAPFSVVEQNATVVRLQPQTRLAPRGETIVEPAVFFVHDREALAMHYERDPSNPRVAHTFVLRVDAHGNVTRAATVAYPARTPHPDVAEQGQGSVAVSETSFCAVDDVDTLPDVYRASVPAEQRAYELHIAIDDATQVLLADLDDAIDEAARIAPEAPPSAGDLRLLSAARSFYYADDLSGALALGQCGTRALPQAAHAAAFSEGQRAAIFATDVSGTLLSTDGGYVADDVDAIDVWWSRSGRQVFDAAHFYLPVTGIDPFGNQTTIEYDAHDLFVTELTDAIGNVVAAAHDYRVLAPRMVTDPNGNRIAVAFDTRGVVVAMARMGKEGASEGDTLAEPTSTFSYDPFAWRDDGEPVHVRTRSRETYGEPGTRWLERISFFDGSGSTLLEKVTAEPGLAPERDENGELVLGGGELVWSEADPRWIGTGRTFVDNKGNPVKQYEPYFSSTDGYEDEVEVRERGVTPLLHYDPLGRLVRTDLPDGTLMRVAFSPWQTTTHDPNDTVSESEWFAERDAMAGGNPEEDAEKRAAVLTEAAAAGTPTVAHSDALGRAVRVVQHLRDLTQDPAADIFLATRTVLDIVGNVLQVVDARDNTAQTNVPGMAGQVLHTTSVDAGERRSVADVMGAPLRLFDGMSRIHRFSYDTLRRVTHHYVQPAVGDETLALRNVYGELAADPEDDNLRGRLLRQYDGAGLVVNRRFSFDGNLEEQERTLVVAFDSVPDWIDLATETTLAGLDTAAASLLETQSHTTAMTADALGRPVMQTTPDASVTRYGYNDGGLLESVEADVRGASPATVFVENIDYDVWGRRALIEHGNGTTTTYDYDERSFRLRRLHTTRASSPGDPLQDLRYFYDPVGNIVEVQDFAQQTVYFDNAEVQPHQLFEYDSLYRLVLARGREHSSLSQPTHSDFTPEPLPHPNDPAPLRNYEQTYVYDEVGNITRMRHQAGNGSFTEIWTRGYDYAEDGNRLLATSLPGDDVEDPDTYSAEYEYDAHGSMIAMPHLAAIDWDHADRMQHADLGGGGDVYFQYDAQGNRVRKVRVNQAGTVANERIYVGAFERYRERAVDSPSVLGDVDLERDTLHVSDDTGRIVMVETLTIEDGDPVASPANISRYQYGNHLGSSSVEADDAANIISYEEYHPYGTTSYAANDATIEVSAKRYRYIGKERDDETGLYHLGARYYASWLARWNAADPIGLADGVNRYAYARCSPVLRVDPGGMRSYSKMSWGAYDVGIGSPFGQQQERVFDAEEFARDEARALAELEGSGVPEAELELQRALVVDLQATAFVERAVLEYAIEGRPASARIAASGISRDEATSIGARAGRLAVAQAKYEAQQQREADERQVYATASGNMTDAQMRAMRFVREYNVTKGATIGALAFAGGDGVSVEFAEMIQTAEGAAGALVPSAAPVTGRRGTPRAVSDKGLAPGSFDRGGVKLGKKETDLAELLAARGQRVTALKPTGTKREPDFIVNGVRTELKTLDAGGGPNQILNAVLRGKGQAQSLVIDARSSGLSTKEAAQQLRRVYQSEFTKGKITSIEVILPSGGSLFGGKR